jgi:hypothetical protein
MLQLRTQPSGNWTGVSEHEEAGSIGGFEGVAFLPVASPPSPVSFYPVRLYYRSAL